MPSDGALSAVALNFGRPRLVTCGKKIFCSVEITTATSCAAQSY